MTPRKPAAPTIALLSAFGALVLAGCGGSSPAPPSTTSTVVVHVLSSSVAASTSTASTSTASTSPASTTPTGTTSTSSSSTSSAAPAAASHSVTSTSSAPPPRTTPKTTPVTTPARPPKHRTAPLTQAALTKDVSGPAPPPCLQAAGVLGVRSPSVGEWSGTVRLDGPGIYVDGPYTSTGAASTAATSLEGVEDVAQGGLYVVSALLISHVHATVEKVAGCLAASRGHGGLHY